MKNIRIIALAGALLAVVAASMPADAVCPLARQISSLQGAGYSYIYTPGFCDAGYPCGAGTGSISNGLMGNFWVIGAGDPAIDPTSNDNGAWPALEGSGGSYTYGWLYSNAYYGYPGFVQTTWAADPRIDGCPDAAAPAGNLCTAIALYDQDAAGNGYFGLITSAADGGGNYFFGTGSAIRLAPLDRANGPTITGTTRNPDQTVNVTVAAPQIDANGLTLDPACNDAIAGFKTYVQIVPRGMMPPADRGLGSWTEVASNDGLSSDASFVVDCGGVNSDAYVATSVVLDSGFETMFVSANSQRIECGPNVANPDDLQERVRPGSGPVELRNRAGKGGSRR